MVSVLRRFVAWVVALLHEGGRVAPLVDPWASLRNLEPKPRPMPAHPRLCARCNHRCRKVEADQTACPGCREMLAWEELGRPGGVGPGDPRHQSPGAGSHEALLCRILCSEANDVHSPTYWQRQLAARKTATA